ncbi:hypothetical protein R9C00_10445 [Flammeovirgaceae bacterium SG7u.111]|nr:hypothetical protein [Flammeovirgaceae bacterium SG7u.132]WPO37872.1 hypothetical protein R9C00_10445 [Flammeovirgaceae bacterium SG7u.111]
MICTNIPIEIRLRLLFSNNLVYFGLFIIVVIGLFLSVIITDTDYEAHKYVESSTSNGTGTIVGITRTNTTVNDNTIYKYEFEYVAANATLSGYSFSQDINLEIGEVTAIEYITNEPEVSRIVNTTNGSSSIGVLYFLVSVFLLGFLVISIGVFKRVKLIKYLQSGFDIVNSQLVDEMRIPFVRINHSESLCMLTFEYSVNTETKKITKFKTTYHHYIQYYTYPVLINQANNNDVLLLNDLPIRVRDFILSKSNASTKPHDT